MSEAGGLKAGKLPPEMLARLLSKIESDDPRVLLGPGVGEDAALIDFGETVLIAKSDPITFATDLIGWYAVQVNANDIAACGGDPRWFLATALLPVGSPPSAVEMIFEQIHEACQALGVTMVGGHTEMTLGLPRPIVCGTMLGEVAKGAQITTGGARPGDRLILTKGIAIEGASILAREAAGQLRAAGVAQETIDTAAGYLFSPGISVVPDARAARSVGGVTAMHDPTEGGLAGALAELAVASGAGLRVDADAVRVLPEASAVCDALGADPWGLIASGALLIAARPDAAGAVIAAVEAAGISAAEIGEVRPAAEGLTRRAGGSVAPLPTFERDEVARVLESL
ncbi:MAG: AIR synthase family protein [Dehalococcoidia bacterium]